MWRIHVLKSFCKVGIETLDVQVGFILFGFILLLPVHMIHGILCTWGGTVVLLGDICHRCLYEMLMCQQNKSLLQYK
jgi:hypothetical protein